MHARNLNALSHYKLPESVSRLAPNRYPFSDYSARCLAMAAEEVLRSPERCGAFPRAVRNVLGLNEHVTKGRWTILEAHLNAEEIEDRVRDFLLSLGFEEDGLCEAVPSHFSGHFTLKYKFGEGDGARKRQCYHLLRSVCDQLIEYFTKKSPSLEYNLEVEVYNSRHRRAWIDREARAWPNDLFESEVMGNMGRLAILAPQTTLTKRADIHAKLASELGEDVTVSIATALGNIGFYPVVTWSGNTVLTGQFVSVSTAKKLFAMITNASEECGGIAELTLEPTPFFFRSTILVDGRPQLAAIPPLISTDS